MIFAPRVVGDVAVKAWRARVFEVADHYAIITMAGYKDSGDDIDDFVAERKFMLMNRAILDLEADELTNSFFTYTLEAASNVRIAEEAIAKTSYFASGELV